MDLHFNKYNFKNKNLINESLNTDLIDNHEFFKIKYDEHINNERDNSQYLWNEIVLNLSLKNLEFDIIFNAKIN